MGCKWFFGCKLSISLKMVELQVTFCKWLKFEKSVQTGYNLFRCKCPYTGFVVENSRKSQFGMAIEG